MDENAIHQLIHEIDGYKIMLDFDLANLYGVTTKALNQAMKRNLDRFPPDFCFQLTKEKWDSLRSKIVTSSWEGDQNALDFLKSNIFMGFRLFWKNKEGNFAFWKTIMSYFKA